MTDVFVGLGSNMGHRMRHLSRAVHEIADLENTDVVKVSHAYETEPWGLRDQELFKPVAPAGRARCRECA